MYVMEGAGRVHAAPCGRRINSFSRLRVDCVKERSGEKSFSLLRAENIIAKGARLLLRGPRLMKVAVQEGCHAT